MTSTVVSSDVDLFSTEVAVDPYPVLAELRELSRVIHFPKYDVWMLSRYDDVKEASGDWETYTSRHGVALYDDFNKTLTGGVLATDPPEHDHLRAILYDKLTPRALRGLRIEVEGWAHEIADQVIDRGEFDACTDLAFEYPVTVMSNLLGLPEEGRERYRPGADAIFAGFGPLTEYLGQRIEALVKYNEWMDAVADPSKLTAGRWGATIMAAAAEGRLTRQEAVNTLKAFMTAGMDTTVNATTPKPFGLR
jgi:cytochrome P450